MYSYGFLEDPPFRPDPVDFQGPTALTTHEINDLVERAIERGNHPRRQNHRRKKREKKGDLVGGNHRW